MTGDRLGIAPRVIGGALWGRISGFVAGIVNSVVEWFTGKDIGDHIYAYFFGKPEAGTNKGIASKDGNGIGASVTTYPTDSLHKSEEGRSGRTALPQRSDVSRPLANSLRYESHLTYRR
jgi:hypothetical protein